MAGLNLSLLGLLWLFLLFSHPLASRENNQRIVRAEYLMGTLLQVEVEKSDEAKLEPFFQVIREDEKVYSSYLPDSELSRFEKSYREWVALSPVLFQLFEWGERFYLLSHTLFDPSLGSVRIGGADPLQTLLLRARAGFAFVQLDRARQRARILKRGLQFDFGGIGKGYAVDRGVAILKKRGVKKGVINFGGQVTVLQPFSKRRYPIRLRSGGMLCALREQTLCVSSERERGAHIYDPRAQRFVQDVERISVAVSPQATVCDALSTIGFIDFAVGKSVAAAFPGSFLFVKDAKGWSSPPPFCKEASVL